ncbi:arginase family protein [Vibrio sp. CAU 1672]|uniref:arginase family protein n=1 Tax=Vibrio sp. CAU 1672 TaxID=3032594 RepID=UPI0023DA9041|nr:arginase family protein [Vibrio sp. CAU 1672]MDF2153473.1 arginase family protein [Vibrio sp. CAU 1672]
MFSFFKRYRCHPAKNSSQPRSFTFMTVSEYCPPMTQASFESADFSLSCAGDWLNQRQGKAGATHSDHFSGTAVQVTPFQRALSDSRNQHAIPVVISNCTETMLSILPAIADTDAEVGIIHIGHQLHLDQTLEPKLGSAFHFALCRYPNVRLFFAGVCIEESTLASLDYAEDQGCDWITEHEYTFRNRHSVKQQISHYLSHCDQAVISIDLRALFTKSGLEENHALDIRMVLRTLRNCLMSGKVTAINLVGDKEYLIYSKHTKSILEEIHLQAEQVTHAA